MFILEILPDGKPLTVLKYSKASLALDNLIMATVYYEQMKISVHIKFIIHKEPDSPKLITSFFIA